MPKTRGDAADAQRRRILDAAELVLRRYGPGKTTVSDVAREIGQSHASVYRYFASKSELIGALVKRWLETFTLPLEAIAEGPGSASDRLQGWLLGLFHAKVRKVNADPEYFATYQAASQEAHEVIEHHMAWMLAQVESIIASGIEAGEFAPQDPRRATRTILNASMRFHHPALLGSPATLPNDEEAQDVVALLVAGLKAKVSSKPGSLDQ